MIKPQKKYLMVFVMFLCITIPNFVLAQDPLDDGPEPPPAPIDNHIYTIIGVVVIAIFCWFVYLNKKKQITNP